MALYSTTITLILVMDPLGNIPLFVSILDSVERKKRHLVLIREAIIAFIILSLFLFCGPSILHGLNLSESALSVAGGIILFLIALRMIFPPPKEDNPDHQMGEPFIVPLAIPLLAGPSALATVLLFASQARSHLFSSFIAVLLASVVVTGILLCATSLRRFLGKKGLVAIERLMGMALTTISVQMFMTGISLFLQNPHP